MGTTSFRFGLILVCLLVAAPIFAQQTGAVSGTVTDSSGAVVPGASVTLKDEGSGDERKSITNSEGFFNFASVQSGVYSVIVEMKGFKTFERKAIGMNLGDRRNITGIALEVQSSTTETVTVTSSVEEVTRVDSGEKASVIGVKQLDNVQILGRNAAEFIKFRSGAHEPVTYRCFNEHDRHDEPNGRAFVTIWHSQLLDPDPAAYKTHANSRFS